MPDDLLEVFDADARRVSAGDFFAWLFAGLDAAFVRPAVFPGVDESLPSAAFARGDLPAPPFVVVPAFVVTVSAAAAMAPAAAPAAAPVAIFPATSMAFSISAEADFPFADVLLFVLDLAFFFSAILSSSRCSFYVALLQVQVSIMLRPDDTNFFAFYNWAMQTDVLVIGAGPTGLALAVQLIRYGVDFVVVDERVSTTPYSKAIGVQARTLEIYDQVGLADRLVDLGAIAEKVRMVESGEVRAELPLEDIGRGMSPFPFLLLVEQGKHEALLYDHIHSHGRDVRWETKLESFSQTAEGAAATVTNGAGEIETIDARYLVGCDGSHSFVRHTLGLSFEGGTFERLFYVADVDIDWKFEHDAVHVCLAKSTITAFFPMVGPRQWRIVGTFPEGHQGQEGEVLYEEIERQIIADTELDLDITKVNWFSVYRVHSRHVSNFSSGRCFLAGDSAHIHTPAGAQGMNTGIQDGYNLAWKLAAVLKNGADASLLDTYNEERLPNARRLLQTTDRLFQFGASDDWFVSFFRTQIFPYVASIGLNIEAVRNAVFSLVSQIGIDYRGSSLCAGTDDLKVKAGDRMPYFLVDGDSIYDRLRSPRFHMLTFSDGGSRPPEIEPDLAATIDKSIFPLYPNVAEIFGTTKTFTVLLRPDNYIGLVSSGTPNEDIEKYLSALGNSKPPV